MLGVCRMYWEGCARLREGLGGRAKGVQRADWVQNVLGEVCKGRARC